MPTEVKLDLASLNPDGLVNKAEAIVAAMTLAVITFPTPTPALTVVTASAYNLDQLLALREALKTQAQTNTQNIRQAVDILEENLRALGSYVETIANAGEAPPAAAAATIESAGMDVAGTNTPVGPMPKITGLSGTPGDETGEVDLHWNPERRGLGSYVVQATSDPAASTGWVNQSNTTPRKSKCSIQGLPSATKQWFRVAAIGTAGQGPWSDPVQVTVP